MGILRTLSVAYTDAKLYDGGTCDEPSEKEWVT